MSVDKDTVKKIARLARLDVPEERQEQIAGELQAILSWIEELSAVDTANIEPLASVTGHSLPLRVDKVTDGNKVDDILANAPEQASGFFVVPKVVE
jgi:aspartyl-tRNA(Asn)/glutamyl-tRNA(Gln) amidotransferase subunit C